MYASATATAFSSLHHPITSNTNCGEAALVNGPLTPRHIGFAQCGPASNINCTPITNRRSSKPRTRYSSDEAIYQDVVSRT
jgi:hypothetical protein